jgi:transcriptional regulator of acetoin/glycerol metabolism
LALANISTRRLASESRALAKAKGNRAEAARSLVIGRATLYRFMRRLCNESIGEPRTNEPSEEQ